MYHFCLSLSVESALLDVFVDEDILTLEQAISLTRNAETVSQSYEYRAAGFEQESIAESSLPDPKLKLGVMNLPTDSFDLEQEAMTQLQVGVIQAFPAWFQPLYQVQNEPAKSRESTFHVKKCPAKSKL